MDIETAGDIRDLKLKYMDESGHWRWADMPIHIYRYIDRYDSRGTSYSIGVSYPTQYTGFSSRVKNEHEQNHKNPEIYPIKATSVPKLLGYIAGIRPKQRTARRVDGMDEWGPVSSAFSLRRRKK